VRAHSEHRSLKRAAPRPQQRQDGAHSCRSRRRWQWRVGCCRATVHSALPKAAVSSNDRSKAIRSVGFTMVSILPSLGRVPEPGVYLDLLCAGNCPLRHIFSSGGPFKSIKNFMSEPGSSAKSVAQRALSERDVDERALTRGFRDAARAHLPASDTIVGPPRSSGAQVSWTCWEDSLARPITGGCGLPHSGSQPSCQFFCWRLLLLPVA
jgi:hypothetical protein